MKKFVSILLALAIVFSLGVTAFAAENTGSITITNATIDETYAVYKIFDASISVDANGATDAVAYSITTESQFFTALFGDDGTADNTYFVYNANTGAVTKKDGVNDAELIKYLTELVAGGTYATAVDPVEATTDEVKFENLPYGYYLITSSLGTTVTINSNTPDVQVIDKNQKPGGGFNKWIQNGVKEDGTPNWEESNTANISDEITYRINFTATNYDGDKKIKYYSVNDQKGDAIWVDFESFEVYVGGELLPRGYYLDQGNNDNGDWEFLGNWGTEEKDRNNAQWYLVHVGEDEFRITIPWLEGHEVEGDSAPYTLKFSEDGVSKYESPIEVEIIYNAVVEANAAIGETTHGNRFNKAYASWTSEYETGSTKPEEVVTYVYGIGLLKDDIATGVNLAGAKFRIYRDENCTDPVYVIPTDVAGVYIIDSLGTPLEDITGEGKLTTRDRYENHLEGYLGADYQTKQDNYVVSQVNGKLAILGLAEGTYYLKEVEAPSGYNALTQAIEITAGENISPFIIFANKESGEVADIQQTDGIHTEYRLDLTHTVVHNSKGVVLPSTGGEGTFWLITIGTLLAIGFAVFLITHKKMSIYVD